MGNDSLMNISTEKISNTLKKLSENPIFLENPVVELEAAFSDARGSIQPLADEDMKSAVLISSKKGTVRANHYHKTDWHYCYVLSGSIQYYHRPRGSNLPPRQVTIKTGQLFFTPPLVEHAMVFPEDTVFICLGKNSRDQAAYEADIERVDLFPGAVGN